MPQPGEPPQGLVEGLLHEEARLLPQLAGVFRLDAGTYDEIAASRYATPGAFAVVLATALVWGIGRTTPALVFLQVAGAVGVWGVSSALIWAVGALRAPERAEYPPLLRCLGFAFAWNALQVGASLPWVGWLFLWAGLGLWSLSMVLATRAALRGSTGEALAVCALALLTPLVLVFVGTCG